MRIPLAILTGLLGVVACCAATETQLTEGDGNCVAPAWCGSMIAFHTDRNGLDDVWAMNEDGEAVNSWPVTQDPADTDKEPAWNASCTHVYFHGSNSGTHNRLYYVNASGPPYQPVVVSLGTGDDRAPHASGGGVVFHSDREGNDDIMWMPLGGESASTYLTTDASDDRFPSWSPGDSLVVFASDRSGNWDIWLMRAAGEGGGLWPLTTDVAEESAPSFSPAGDRVAFHRVGQGIFVIDVATRQEYQVTTDGTDRQPCWSPDGAEMAFARQTGDYLHIWATDNVPETALQSMSWGRLKALYR